MSKRDDYYFGLAEKVADISDYPRIHIGAIIVCKRKIIGIGRNQSKTHILQSKYNVHNKDVPGRERKVRNSYLHAEISAIISTHRDDLEKCSIYIFRKDKNGKLAMAKPCVACMNAIKDYGITNVYYTDVDGYKHITP